MGYWTVRIEVQVLESNKFIQCAKPWYEDLQSQGSGTVGIWSTQIELKSAEREDRYITWFRVAQADSKK